jgi:hypothetical protein
MSKQKVYLVVDTLNAPGRVYAVFADEESALDFRDHYHADEADVEERSLLYGQHVSSSGYIE